jgi:hypothetical protein
LIEIKNAELYTTDVSGLFLLLEDMIGVKTTFLDMSVILHLAARRAYPDSQKSGLEELMKTLTGII